MKYYLVKYEDNWADEMDITGIYPATEEYVKNMKDIVDLYFTKKDGFNFGIGTNEDIYYDSGESLLSSYTFQEITEAEYDVICKLNIDMGFDPIDRLSEHMCWGCEGEEDESICKTCPNY